MEFLDPGIEAFVTSYTKEESEVLKRLSRETWANVLTPRMLSGHLQGRVLSMLSHMIRPERILEIGTYTGYSAICLAEGLQQGGTIHTIDINAELKDMARKYFEAAAISEKVVQYVGDASKVIPTISGTFDLVFIDADKENYSRYFDLVFDKVNPGGYIVADNVLWSGKVIDEQEIRKDRETRAIVDYCKKVHEDARVANVIFPIRDGLMVCRKTV